VNFGFLILVNLVLAAVLHSIRIVHSLERLFRDLESRVDGTQNVLEGPSGNASCNINYQVLNGK